jgi:hypothetical protein
MHPAFVTAIAAAQRQDKLALAAAARRARSARRGPRPEPSPRHAVRRHEGPTGPQCPAAPTTQERQKVGA